MAYEQKHKHSWQTVLQKTEMSYVNEAVKHQVAKAFCTLGISTLYYQSRLCYQSDNITACLTQIK